MKTRALAFLIIVAGCGSPPQQPACRSTGAPCDGTTFTCCTGLCRNGACCQANTEACSSSSDCCPGLYCFSGVCIPMCKTAGQACGSGCCNGLTCTNGICQQPAMCGTQGARCSSMYDCCQGVTCPRYGTTCALGSIGDPCAENSDCHTNLVCNGSWCTKTCGSDADCGTTNYCIADSSGGYSCFPFCRTNADCAIYSGTSCTMGTDPGGLSLPICGG